MFVYVDYIVTINQEPRRTLRLVDGICRLFSQQKRHCYLEYI